METKDAVDGVVSTDADVGEDVTAVPTSQKPPWFGMGQGKPRTKWNGYEKWQTTIDCKNHHVSHHRLLAVALFGFDEVVGKEVHHKNGCKFDNRPENLEVLTGEEHRRIHRASNKASNARKKWDSHSCINAVLGLWDELGHLPSQKEYRESNTFPKEATIRHYVGDWDEVERVTRFVRDTGMTLPGVP